MRALVISDIHSNLPALDAVLSAAPSYDEVWNLGDIVGYGANPNEVTSKVRSLGGIVVRGNHDRACSGVMARSKLLNFSRDAYSAAIWTQSALSEDNREWLSKLPCGPIWPLKRRAMCVHGAPGNEDEYLFFHDDVWAVLCDSAARIILHGHTHWQRGWSWYQGEATAVEPTFQSKTEMECFELPIRTRHRYLINPGSVGQPRDGDWRAAFAIYDDVQSKLIWYRVPYKVHIAQRRIRGVGLPDSLADRLKEGR